MSGSETGTVARVLRLLASFNGRAEWPLQALAQHLDLPPSTTHRLLNLCAGEGFVASDGKGVYRPGLALYRLAGGLTQTFPLRRIAMPLLERFSAEFSEVALLGLIDRQALRMFYAAKSEPTATIRYVVELNRLETLAWGAVGRSLMAYLSEVEIETIIQRDERSPARGLKFDPHVLRRQLAEIRAAGYARSQGERTLGGVGIAVPFFDAGGAVVGNITATVPSFRHDEARSQQHLMVLKQMAGELSHAMGGNGREPHA
jgi:DNA-binding IclR family transcriptional regulator